MQQKLAKKVDSLFETEWQGKCSHTRHPQLGTRVLMELRTSSRAAEVCGGLCPRPLRVAHTRG